MRSLQQQCGNSSVGRARPCQGRGREFESRFPLQISKKTSAQPRFFLVSSLKARWQSGYAADCNSVYAGSIPTRASNYLSVCRRQVATSVESTSVMLPLCSEGIITKGVPAKSLCSFDAPHNVFRGYGEIGRHNRLKICRPVGHAGSSPATRTIFSFSLSAFASPAHIPVTVIC